MKDDIEQLFERLEGQFDMATPDPGHESRFVAKMKAQANTPSISASKGHSWWKPLLAAASVVLIAGLFWMSQTTETDAQLADVSPEMQQTERFFIQTIESELAKIKQESSPETQKIVDDAIGRLAILENDYKALQKDLSESGEDKRVIYAMITNFQNRIDLLEQVLEQIEAVKALQHLEPEIL